MENKRKENCVCTSDCKRRGNCEACKAYHHSRGTLTSCEKLVEEKKQ